MARLRAWAAADWRRRLPPLGRWPLRAAGHALWGLAAAPRVWRFAHGAGMGPAATGRLYLDCLLAGAPAMDAHVWRTLFGSRHPLPPRAASLLLPRLGDPAGPVLLSDKLETQYRLTAAGIGFPTLLHRIGRGERVDPAMLPDAGPAGLFIKPRHGHGGRHAMALIADADGWRADGRKTEPAALSARLTRWAADDELLVQERLSPLTEWEALAPAGRTPVLRLTTARAKGAPAVLHSALLTMAVPGADPSGFLKGAVHAPVDPATGCLAAGLMLAAPRERLEKLPWNGARLAGRLVPAFDRAVAMALSAMEALPAMALVNWDIVPTPAGPVLLEGNSAGNWILTSLAGACGLDAGPLSPVLATWMGRA